MRLAFLSDIHLPEHHRQAWPLTLQILPDLNLDLVHIGGDGVEFESLSRFEVPPDRRYNLRHDVKETRKELTRLRTALPNVPIEWKCGNHEYRLTRYLYTKAGELDGIEGISVPEIFKFNDFGIQWIPRERWRRIGRLLLLHGDEVRVGSVHPARNLYFKISGNLLCGHYHAEGKYIHTLSDKSVHGAWVNSCLRTLRPDWAPFSQWTLGFTICEFSQSGFFHIDQVLYLKRGGKLWCSVGGKEYNA